MLWLRQLVSLSLVVLLVGSCLAQTFQYSRGWTNGKRSYPMTQAGCQLQRLKAILEGKVPANDNSYLLCELYRVPEDEMRLERLNKVQSRNPIGEDIVEK